jgi:hypothetical protein
LPVQLFVDGAELGLLSLLLCELKTPTRDEWGLLFSLQAPGEILYSADGSPYPLKKQLLICLTFPLFHQEDDDLHAS